jgi:hypothetical protein
MASPKAYAQMLTTATTLAFTSCATAPAQTAPRPVAAETAPAPKPTPRLSLPESPANDTASQDTIKMPLIAAICGEDLTPGNRASYAATKNPAFQSDLDTINVYTRVTGDKPAVTGAQCKFTAATIDLDIKTEAPVKGSLEEYPRVPLVVNCAGSAGYSAMKLDTQGVFMLIADPKAASGNKLLFDPIAKTIHKIAPGQVCDVMLKDDEAAAKQATMPTMRF